MEPYLLYREEEDRRTHIYQCVGDEGSPEFKVLKYLGISDYYNESKSSVNWDQGI